MTPKNYPAWHAKKTVLNQMTDIPYFYEREVWWVAIGHNIGDEEDGKGRDFARPVLIVRKFNKALFYGVPLTTAMKTGKYYQRIVIKDGPRMALISHLRDYDAKRLLDRVDFISELDYARVQLALINLLKQPAYIGPKIFYPSRTAS